MPNALDHSAGCIMGT